MGEGRGGARKPGLATKAREPQELATRRSRRKSRSRVEAGAGAAGALQDNLSTYEPGLQTTQAGLSGCHSSCCLAGGGVSHSNNRLAEAKIPFVESLEIFGGLLCSF